MQDYRFMLRVPSLPPAQMPMQKSIGVNYLEYNIAVNKLSS